MTNLRMTRGDTPTIKAVCMKPRAEWADPNVAEPLTLTGVSLWFTAKKSWNDTDAEAVFQLTIGSGITVTDVVNGLVDIKPTNASTIGLSNSRETVLVWDLQAKDASGSIETLDKGTLTVEPEATQAS